MLRKRDFLIGLRGRVREVATLWIAMGAMMIPLALVLKIEVSNIPSWVFWGMIAYGLFSFFVGVWDVFKEDKVRMAQVLAIIDAINKVHGAVANLVNEIRRERQERDERSNKP